MMILPKNLRKFNGHLIKHIKGNSEDTINIAFQNKANMDNFLEEFGLDIFKKQNLNINLYMIDASK
jgi:hypothetical protein